MMLVLEEVLYMDYDKHNEMLVVLDKLEYTHRRHANRALYITTGLVLISTVLLMLGVYPDNLWRFIPTFVIVSVHIGYSVYAGMKYRRIYRSEFNTRFGEAVRSVSGRKGVVEASEVRDTSTVGADNAKNIEEDMTVAVPYEVIDDICIIIPVPGGRKKKYVMDAQVDHLMDLDATIKMEKLGMNGGTWQSVGWIAYDKDEKKFYSVQDYHYLVCCEIGHESPKSLMVVESRIAHMDEIVLVEVKELVI